MRAIIQEKYGPVDQVLRLKEVQPPTIGDDEVLVRVKATSVHPDVWHMIVGRPYVLRLMGAGVRLPKNPVPGTELSGLVEAVGDQVTRFRPGDEVFGESLRGMQWINGGTFAELAAAPEATLAPKPENVSWEQAGAVSTSGIIALHMLLHEGKIQEGEHVLINGAGGGVGTLLVQLAKVYGAKVTAVDATHKLEALASIGADHVIDHTKEDFTHTDDPYDLVIDIPGNRHFQAIRRVLSDTGRYVLVGHDAYGTHGRRVLGSIPSVLKLAAISPFFSQVPGPFFSGPDKKGYLETLRGLMERGELKVVVDRVFPLEQVPEAIAYLASGRATGKVVVRAG